MDSSNNVVIDQLARTKGWTLFFAVMLWIGAVMLMFAGIVMVIIAAVGASGSAGAASAFADMGGPMFGIGIGVLYFVMAVAYVYPALKLTKFSRKVSHLMESPSEAGLASALNEQRAFWKYVGILMIVFIALYVVIIIGAFVVGMLGATRLS